MEVVLWMRKTMPKSTIPQCFMWFGSHFTVSVTRRLLLSSRVFLLVINLLTTRERVREKRKRKKSQNKRVIIYYR